MNVFELFRKRRCNLTSVSNQKGNERYFCDGVRISKRDYEYFIICSDRQDSLHFYKFKNRKYFSRNLTFIFKNG